jgi:hypothetical protein
MNRLYSRAIPAALSLAIVAVIVTLVTRRQFYTEAMLSAFFACSLLGAAILHFAVAPRRDYQFVGGCTAVLAAIDYGGLGFPHGATIFVPLLSLTGLSSLMVFGVRTAWSQGKARGLYLRAFIPAILFVVSEYAASDLHRIASWLHPKTWDLYLYSFDASLGIQLSFVLGRMFHAMPWFRVLSLIGYIGLAVPVAVVAAGLLRARSERVLPAIVAFVITGPVGVIFYNLFPACGPKFVFQGQFPSSPLTTSQAARLLLEPISLNGIRNAIPSLHMAWVLLAWWNSRGLSVWIRALAMFFVVFTVTSTLGTGEHYLVDLVVAFPFAIMVQALADYTLPLRDPQRWRPLLAGLLMTLAWMGALRFANRLWWVSPLVGFVAALSTVLASIYLFPAHARDAAASQK